MVSVFQMVGGLHSQADGMDSAAAVVVVVYVFVGVMTVGRWWEAMSSVGRNRETRMHAG